MPNLPTIKNDCRKIILLILCILFISSLANTQSPPIEPGVSQALAQWRAAHYSDVRYKLNLTLEKMSPVLKGTMEIRVNVSAGTQAPSPANAGSSGVTTPIILDWRKIKGHEDKSAISNVYLNGVAVSPRCGDAGGGACVPVEERSEHLIFRDGVALGENVIKFDFTSPILTSGSAITRYVDKEDGAEYIYSLFVPSDASTAFPVFDQPDLKARFTVQISTPRDWSVVSNTAVSSDEWVEHWAEDKEALSEPNKVTLVNWWTIDWSFQESKPISTYVFAFAAGPWERVAEPPALAGGTNVDSKAASTPPAHAGGSAIYVRRSQAAKFKPHAAEVFRLNREGIKYLESYFDYKFPFPKYDLVLIPEFPFGGMEHAGATFLREASIIFPTEPTKSDHISRANLIFHEAAHQWFGDTVTMRWFDDLWLKEGFAEFMAYKTLEKVMPDANAWKVFYERNKQAAYATDSTKGTTPIYQKIDNLSAAKSAYGNIVYRKAPSFLRQAEFYLGEDNYQDGVPVGKDNFQTAVRAFLKKHAFVNADWGDLLNEFANASWRSKMGAYQDPVEHESRIRKEIINWGETWVKKPGVAKISLKFLGVFENTLFSRGESDRRLPLQEVYTRRYNVTQSNVTGDRSLFAQKFEALEIYKKGKSKLGFYRTSGTEKSETWQETPLVAIDTKMPDFRDLPICVLPNINDYGYGIFLLDDKSRDYVLKNIQNEKDPFLRSMMWGSLWDSVREAELDPQEYVELAIRQLGGPGQKPARSKGTLSIEQSLETDETIIQSLLGRVGTAVNYYLPDAQRTAIAPRLEAVLLDRLQHAPTAGQRITFYRAFVTTASTAKGREVLKEMLAQGSSGDQRPPNAVSAGSQHSDVPLRTKDRFDIVTRLIILGDPEAPKLLAQLEKTETGDDAKRYAYAARAGIATAENKAKYWSDFTANKDISESWIEAAFGPFNSVLHSDLTLPYLERALAELPNHKRTRKIFFVNGWLGAFIGGQKSEAALAIVNKFLGDNPNLDRDLRLKILENVDLIERAVKIRKKFSHE